MTKLWTVWENAGKYRASYLGTVSAPSFKDACAEIVRKCPISGHFLPSWRGGTLHSSEGLARIDFPRANCSAEFGLTKE